ncbi:MULTISPECIES: sulfite oxidase-like oxidoreductase [Metallosphaera]|uniref:sulfite oxidase-like oxidoreductase n=1 Tax=Metallosphaera TaxID=41980 RepID=UPI001F0672D6|nr:sulfite oxidase-like oxidoreductase [Metallosphaera sedula]MCH1771122.1 sulfite oxidase-like oxidoreductase [Metallosphaera sedula]MCP6729493.1 sulfite oxidase-like oxidoreductase [Metallosphaera sedula]
MENQKQMPPGQRPIKRFIYYAALGVPEVNVEEYRFKVTGMVERELSFTYQELLNMMDMEYKRDFHCVTGWSVLDVSWKGINLKRLVERASPKPEAKWVIFYSLDGYTATVPLEDVMNEDSILVLIMNGRPLTKEEGFPARPFFPHLYGWKSAKWVTSMELVPEYVDGYWEERGYHERGNVWDEERFKGFWGRHSKKRPII